MVLSVKMQVLVKLNLSVNQDWVNVAHGVVNVCQIMIGRIHDSSKILSFQSIFFTEFMIRQKSDICRVTF